MVDQEVAKVSKDDVRRALKRRKMMVEVWKSLGEEAAEFLTGLFHRISASEKVPEERRRSELVIENSFSEGEKSTRSNSNFSLLIKNYIRETILLKPLRYSHFFYYYY